MKIKLAIGMAAATLSASAVFAAQGPLQNYDAAASSRSPSIQTKKLAGVAATSKYKAAFKLPAIKDASIDGYRSERDLKTGEPTFLWAAADIQPATATPLKATLIADAAGRDYLSKQSTTLGLSRDSIANAKLVDLHDTGSGPLIARYQQYHDGVEVFGKNLNVMMDRGMKLVATSGQFAAIDSKASSSKSAAVSGSDFSLQPQQALTLAFADFSGESLQASAFTAVRTADDYTVYGGVARNQEILPSGEQRTKKFYYPLNGKLVPAYYAEVNAISVDGADQYSYGYLIAADSGKVLFRKDLIAYDTYSYRTYADTTGTKQPFDSPLGNGYDPFVGTAGNGKLTRTPAPTALVTLQNGPIKSNDPWLPAGATVSTGNNVDAYLDLFGTTSTNSQGQTIVTSGDGFDPNTTDIRASVSGSNTFDYPYTPDTDPSTAAQRQFAIINLFYMNNWLHDWWYDDGFNEAAGNAQTSNLGRGGVEGDAIHAEGQDFSGRNNANMNTPPDGGHPRMQMYLFDGPVNGEVTTSAGSFAFGTAAFGPTIFDVSAPVVLINDGTAPTTNGCETPFTNAAALNGKIALIDRGTCGFAVKVKNAQNNGAAAVIIANSMAGTIAMGGSDTSITIGSLSISQADGQTLKTALANGTVTARVRRSASIDVDGTLDNQIIAHEWFHYVSNRLIGNALGLSGQQGGGMGEGWSDFSAMMLTVRAEDRQVSGNDTFQGAYPQAYYATNDEYYGIRRAPYSTSFGTFPLTFKHIQNGVALPTGVPIAFGQNGASNAEVHNTGEIWCNTLWEIYASLLNDPRYSFTAAQDRMKRYIISGLKMTPNQPTILEARDALLAAAYATDKQDFALFAAAFAKRGMGVGAVAPDRNDLTNSGVVESFVAQAGSFEATDASIDFGYVNGADGYIDNDGELDPGETALLSVTVRSNGTNDIKSPVTAKLTSDGDTTFGNGGVITFPASATQPITYGGTVTGTITVKLNSATATAQKLALTISFPAATDNGANVLTPPPIEIDLSVNYDIAPATRASDDLEQPLAAAKDWLTALIGSGQGWAVVDGTGVFNTGNLWYAPDNSGASDVTLATPALAVGTAAFSIAFDHFYRFEFAGTTSSGALVGYDGGVIEISTDGGTTWTDAVKAGGTFTTGGGYNGTFLGLGTNGATTPDDSGNAPGFVGDNSNANNGLLEHVVLSFGTAYAGKSVKLRFREVSDGGTGDFGWAVDNVAFTGITNKPFSSVVAENNVPDNHPPVANAGPDTQIALNNPVQLDGSASSDPDAGDKLTYLWTQTSGPAAATITGASTAKPSVTATVVGTYVYTLKVSDIRTASSTDTVTVTVNPIDTDDGGGAIGLWLLLPGLGAAWLRRRRRG